LLELNEKVVSALVAETLLNSSCNNSEIGFIKELNIEYAEQFNKLELLMGIANETLLVVMGNHSTVFTAMYIKIINQFKSIIILCKNGLTLEAFPLI
jgi:hypothetical protein